MTAARLKNGTTQGFRPANSERIFFNLSWYDYILYAFNIRKESAYVFIVCKEMFYTDMYTYAQKIYENHLSSHIIFILLMHIYIIYILCASAYLLYHAFDIYPSLYELCAFIFRCYKLIMRIYIYKHMRRENHGKK